MDGVQGKTTLLLVTHVAIRQGPRGPQIDDQTAAGISQWCRHFDSVTYCGIADETTNMGVSSSTWVDTANCGLGEQVTVIALPRAYRVAKMAKEYKRVRAVLRKAIAQHRYLCFTIGGLIGDWPALAAIESIRQKRRYAAWIDRVESSVMSNKVIGASFDRRLAVQVIVPIMESYTRYLLRNSAVALLQGLDTFEHYGKWASDPHCTYDTHTQYSDQIEPDVLACKQERILSGAPLNIIYVGRAAAMKGPSDWLETLERLHQVPVPFSATWIGDGPELAAMKKRVANSGLADTIYFPGFAGDRSILLRKLQESDLLVFCHKTPESPRCLIEALVSGCAILGYESAYPRGLVGERGGAVFAPQNDIATLTNKIAELHWNRLALANLLADAAESGKIYNEDSIYAHRAELMQRA